LAEHTVAFISLGCAKNLVNTEQMAALAAEAGYLLAPEADGADIAVLNTCGFIDSAKSEAIEQILALAALKAEGRLQKILVAGCLAERYREEILTELPEVDGLIGCGSFQDIVKAVGEAVSGRVPVLFGELGAPEEGRPRLLSTPRWTAYLKIAEGCDNRCSYCVIPSLRGPYRSRSLEDLVSEAESLSALGVKELIVVAQDITRYGIDLYGRRRLVELLKALCKVEGIRWIRLHYLYPDEIDEELIDTIVREEKILPYLDIPIQHVSDKILRAMNRRGGKAELISLFRVLRERIPGLVLRTSLMCGFPGEGKAEFEELCDFLREAKIERAGVFVFSPQEGTKAARMESQVEPETAEHRAELITELQSRVMDDYLARRIGTTAEVLCEGRSEADEFYFGRSYAESPEVDGRIMFSATEEVTPGTFVAVKITGSRDGEPVGRACLSEEIRYAGTEGEYHEHAE